MAKSVKEPVSDLYEALTLLRPICQAGKGGGASCHLENGETPAIVVSGWSAGCSGGDRDFGNRTPITSELAQQLINERLVHRMHDDHFEVSGDGHHRWCELHRAKK